MKILLGAMISLQPFSAGIAWDWMHWATGLRRLGHDVYYVEEVGPKWCVDAGGNPCPFERSVCRETFGAVMRRFGLTGRACQMYNEGEATSGLSADELRAAARGADLLINISGHVKADFLLRAARRRAYVDQDPVYTQLWHAEYGKDLNLKAHDVFFTVGLSVGAAHCPIPAGGIRWHGLLPPVVLDDWPVRIEPRCARFTTVASWAGYADLCFRGEWYGGKSQEFRRFAALPAAADQPFEVAARRHEWDHEGVALLRASGWVVTDATRIDGLDGYQRYIGDSRAEIGIARSAYVKGRSGWFSDRSAHYLASGKPVLAQETGFERHLPTGRGLLAFGSFEEAVEGVRAINRDYEAHCRAARAFAEEHLDYAKVLPRMLKICAAA